MTYQVFGFVGSRNRRLDCMVTNSLWTTVNSWLTRSEAITHPHNMSLALVPKGHPCDVNCGQPHSVCTCRGARPGPPCTRAPGTRCTSPPRTRCRGRSWRRRRAGRGRRAARRGVPPRPVHRSCPELATTMVSSGHQGQWSSGHEEEPFLIKSSPHPVQNIHF